MKLQCIIITVFIISILSSCNTANNHVVETTNSHIENGVEGFDWTIATGDTLRVMFNNHPYADAIIAELPGFEALTGIEVDFSLTEEEYYFDKVTYALSSEVSDMDVFMTGAEQLWHYDNLGYIENLAPYLLDDVLTESVYDSDDFFSELLSILSDDSSDEWYLMGLPIGFEIYSLAYNKRIFDEKGIEPPTTFEEMIDLAADLYEHSGTGSYGISIRGTRNWSMINTGYISYYSMFGAKDFEIKDGNLQSKVDSNASITMNSLWSELVQTGSSSDWHELAWYDCADEFGYGKAAMFLDADIVSLYVNNNEEYPEAGHIAWVPMPLPEGIEQRTSNVWTWALSMNRESQQKKAAWLFIQYFTGYEQLYKSATLYDNGDMPRQSIWADSEFREQMSENEGYLEAFDATINNADILYTHHIHFFETATVWAEYIQRIVLEPDSDVGHMLQELKAEMDRIVSQ